MNRVHYIIDILRLTRRLQRENHCIDLIFSSGCNMAEIILLIEIDSFPDYHAKALAFNLSADATSISKAIKRLTAKGLLATESSRKDRRFKQIKTTKKGKEVIKKADRDFNGVLEKLSFGLSTSEISKLAELTNYICDQLGIAQSKLRPSDHIFRPAQRRLARLMGANNNQVPGTNTSIHTWQILAELKECDLQLRNSDLADRLFLDAARVSFLATELENMQLVKRQKTNTQLYLVLTDKGKDFLNNMEMKAAEYLYEKSKLVDCPQECIVLFERFIKDIGYGRYKIEDECILTRVSNLEAKDALRRDVVRMLAEQKDSYIPSSILGEQDKVFKVECNGKLSMILQFQGMSPNIVAGTNSRRQLDACLQVIKNHHLI